jgi:isocitrate/isopropylmalate dehydrogenase
MLEFLGWNEEAALLKQSVKSALASSVTTADLGGPKQTVEAGDWLAEFVSSHA